MVNPGRIHTYKPAGNQAGPVIYWMSRDQRASDNWALTYSQELAGKFQQPLAVVFCLSPGFTGAALRQYDFMLKGLEETASRLQESNIPFYLLKGDPPEVLNDFIRLYKVAHLVTDFDPLRVKRNWKTSLLSTLSAGFYEVDSHNIVPCRIASQKLEFGAYTIRPKIKKLLPLYMDEFPALATQADTGIFSLQEHNWNDALVYPSPDKRVVPVTWLRPGSSAADKALESFMDQKLGSFSSSRNDPNADATSNLSPYLHFGQLSAQRIALEILKNVPRDVNTDSFLEELIVRRELSDNFCFYNTAYDTFGGFPDWARKSLDEHRRDEREFTYDFESFENSLTHDPLWNAAQNEMVRSGKMHGYMRMYWAKKILEWTSSPEEALDFSIRLNDRYQLDGRDPNGYTGCAWSIGGVHDRAWQERPVFGKIRYMNFNGCRRKFNVEKYMEKWNEK